MNPDVSQEELRENREHPRKLLFKFGKRKVLITLFILLAVLGFVELSKRVAFVRIDGKNRLLLSALPIKGEDKTVISISPEKGGYYSKKLKVYLSLYLGLSGQEHMGIVKLKEEGKNGEIIIERYKSEYNSLAEAEKNTKNEILKNAIFKNNFTTYDQEEGRVFEIKNPPKRIYFFYYDSFIYILEATNSDMYRALEHIAPRIRFADSEEDLKKSKPETTWTLQRKTTQDMEDVFIFEMSGLNYITRWKDLLLFTYPYGKHSDNILSIYQHDLVTGETKTLFQKESDEYMMSNVAVINDTLYFSLGAYLEQGESYWIDLNSSDKEAHVLTKKSGNIIKIKGRNFFIKSEGDSCWRKSEFSLIDLQTKTLIPVAETWSGCRGNDEYLGINNKDQMVLASYTGVSSHYDYGWPEPSLYTSIIVIPLSTPSIRKYSVPLESMPRDILLVKYSEETDSLLFIGDTIYTYSFVSEELEKILDLPEDWMQYKHNIGFISWKNNIVCFEKTAEENKKTIKLGVNLETKQVFRDQSGCADKDQQKSFGAENKTEKVKRIFKDLRLPSSYIFTEK